ncbi:MAG: hypothetical protein ACTS3F_13555 [Phycisphaerales bacterium]
MSAGGILRVVRVGVGRWVACACVALGAAGLMVPLGGCGAPGFGGGSTLSVASQFEPVVLSPTVRTSLYRSGDRNTADFIVSDIPREELMGLGTELTRPEGVVVHVHMFLRPSAGRTPVEPTASNATATVYVFAGDAAGVYRGAGFFVPDGRSGGRSFGGRLAQADLRLSRASALFDDRLGRSFMEGRIRGELDERGVGFLIDTLSILSAQLPAAPEAGTRDGADGGGAGGE